MAYTLAVRTAGLLLCLTLVGQTPPQRVLSTTTTPNTVTAPIVDFQMVDAQSGWARTETNLFFSKTGGQNWVEITPALPAGHRIDGVHFLGLDHAWLIAHGYDAGGDAVIR